MTNSELTKKLILLGELFNDANRFSAIFAQAELQNSWFTQHNLTFARKTWATTLSEANIKRWLSAYELSQPQNIKKILLIMAGNIPLVGFHDLLCVWVSGHKAVVKLSSEDKLLLPFIVEQLKDLIPEWAEAVTFSDEKVTNFDAVIATGSNNTARYFEYYFGKKPHIIRKNRNSVAVLTGKETQEELTALGKDIFQYYGLGCRSVSKLFVPENYSFDAFFQAIYAYRDIINEQKYANNYDYNKAVYLMSLYKLLENGFLILKEDKSYASPIATLFYEYYTDIEALKKQLITDTEQIQCVVAKGLLPDEIAFGNTQIPQLWEYADNVDTLKFLSNLG